MGDKLYSQDLIFHYPGKDVCGFFFKP